MLCYRQFLGVAIDGSTRYNETNLWEHSLLSLYMRLTVTLNMQHYFFMTLQRIRCKYTSDISQVNVFGTLNINYLGSFLCPKFKAIWDNFMFPKLLGGIHCCIKEIYVKILRLFSTIRKVSLFQRHVLSYEINFIFSLFAHKTHLKVLTRHLYLLLHNMVSF